MKNKTVNVKPIVDYDAELREFMKQKEKQSILQQHKQAWSWWQNSKGRWVTYVPDDERKEGRRQISANDEHALEDKIVKFYKADTSTLTLRILYPQWLEHKTKVSTEATAHRNNTDWNRYYLKDPIIDIPMESLTKNQLEEWMTSMTKSYQMNRTQFGNFSSIIRQMFEYAKDEKLIMHNSFEEININWSKLPKPQRKQDEELIFFSDEAKIMVDYCWEQYHKNRQRTQIFAPLAIVFAFYTGVRIGELVALKFSDINRDGITVQRMLNASNKVVLRTKGTEGPITRTVPLTEEAVAVIEEVKRKKLELGLPVNGYIFAFDDDCDKDPERLMHRVKNTITAYCIELKMLERSMHDVRRTFISKGIDSGLSVKTVMDYVGHNHVETTENNYLCNMRRAEERTAELQKAICY